MIASEERIMGRLLGDEEAIDKLVTNILSCLEEILYYAEHSKKILESGIGEVDLDKVYDSIVKALRSYKLLKSHLRTYEKNLRELLNKKGITENTIEAFIKSNEKITESFIVYCTGVYMARQLLRKGIIKFLEDLKREMSALSEEDVKRSLEKVASFLNFERIYDSIRYNVMLEENSETISQIVSERISSFKKRGRNPGRYEKTTNIKIEDCQYLYT